MPAHPGARAPCATQGCTGTIDLIHEVPAEESEEMARGDARGAREIQL